MDLKLAGAGALVTGGNRGIGKAIAAALVREGAHVALLGRDRDSLVAAQEEVGAAAWVSADTTDDSQVRDAVAAAAEALGRIDVVVNCAAPRAVPPAVPGIAGVDDADLLRQVDTKAVGYLRVIRAALPHLRQAGGGAVVNVSGVNARMTGTITGSMRNIAVVALTKNLADELGPEGIAVSCVHPGLTVTERTQDDPGFLDQARATNALGRAVTATDVAEFVTFLASPHGRIANGAVLGIDGGRPGPIFT